MSEKVISANDLEIRLASRNTIIDNLISEQRGASIIIMALLKRLKKSKLKLKNDELISYDPSDLFLNYQSMNDTWILSVNEGALNGEAKREENEV